MTDILLTGLRWTECRHELRARRKQLGMTQTELGVKMGLANGSAIGQWERGNGCMPTLDTLMRWCRALHLELGFHLTPREEPYETPIDYWDEVA